MNEYLNAYMGNLEHLAKAVKQRDEARAAYKSLVVTSVNASMCDDLVKERDEARKALQAAEQEINIIRADFARHEQNFNNAHILKRERDEARAEAANWKPIGIDACWKDHADTLQKQLDEALADVEKLNNIVDKWMKAYESVREEAAMYHTQRDEADETADFWEAQFDDAQANLAKAYAELSNRTLDSLDSDDAIGSEPLLVVFTFGGLD